MNFYLNKVIVAGNLGKDPEVRTMQSGGSLTNLTVAVGRSTKKDGQWVNETVVQCGCLERTSPKIER